MDTINVKLGNTYIRPVEQAKNLGIIFDRNMNMTAHINNIMEIIFITFQVKTIQTVY